MNYELFFHIKSYLEFHLVPQDFFDYVSDSRSGHDSVEAVVPEVTQEAGSQAEAEAHVKRPVKINTEMKTK
jgi:hypothetical protein